MKLLIPLLALLLASCEHPEIITRVIDGDTVCIGSERIRLAGIDCPELTTRRGQQSRAFTIERLLFKEVIVRRQGLDKYNRTLAVVYVNGANFNQQLLNANLARVWR